VIYFVTMLSDAERCLQPDVIPDSCLQVALSGTDYLTRLERVGITITELSALTASNVSFSTSKKDT